MQELNIRNIESGAEELKPQVIRTPILEWPVNMAAKRFSQNTRVIAKLELFQHTGSFKARAALLAMKSLDSAQLERGVTAVSAGNHAAAVAWAAAQAGTSAKVVMPSASNPYRISLCRGYGAEVILVDNVHTAFEKVKQIETVEGRFFVHPFEGKTVATATATLGLEFHQQLSNAACNLDALIIAVGGGGLCAGVSSASRLLNPDCEIYAVEPEGADTMYQSFLAGSPQKIETVTTIADSLGSPHAAPFSFSLCHNNVDRVVRVSDDEILKAMYLVFQDLKLAVEPAAAAAVAAVAGPLRETLAGKQVGVIICGANIDAESFQKMLQRGAELSEVSR